MILVTCTTKTNVSFTRVIIGLKVVIRGIEKIQVHQIEVY